MGQKFRTQLECKVSALFPVRLGSSLYIKSLYMSEGVLNVTELKVMM